MRAELYQVVSCNNVSEVLAGQTGTFIAVPKGSTEIPSNALCIRSHQAGSILGICALDGNEYELMKVSDSPFVPVLDAAARAANHWHERQFASETQQGLKKMTVTA